MTRFLVTGGAGLVGSHLVDLLLEDEDATVVVLDDFSRGRRSNLDAAAGPERLEIVDADIRDQAVLARVVEGVDTVFHQAALRITQCADDPRLAVEVLVNGTYELLDAAVRAGVRKVVAASSASLYGTAEQFPTPERHHPYNDDTIYGAAKAFAEGLLRSFHAMHGLESVSLRYFNVYGPRMDVSGVYTEVLIRWIERIAAGRAPVVFGDGTETMDFVFVEDVARANVLAATRSSGGAEAFNIASGRETSLNELAGLLLRVMGSDVGVEFGPPRPVNGVRRRLADVRRAREELGFEAQVGLEEGLRRLVAWWSAQHGYARSA